MFSQPSLSRGKNLTKDSMSPRFPSGQEVKWPIQEFMNEEGGVRHNEGRFKGGGCLPSLSEILLK